MIVRNKAFQVLSLLVAFFIGFMFSWLFPIISMKFQNIVHMVFQNIQSFSLGKLFVSIFIPFVFFIISLSIGNSVNQLPESEPPESNSKLQLSDNTWSDTAKCLETRRIEGLKALADWSKWIITIQASFIALITFKFGENTGFAESNPNIVNTAILSFTLSILAATIVLGAIPDALAVKLKNNQLSSNPSQDIYPHPTVFNYVGLKLSIGAFTTAQHVLFILGIVSILIGLYS